MGGRGCLGCRIKLSRFGYCWSRGIVGVCGLLLFEAVSCFFWHLGIGDGDSGVRGVKGGKRFATDTVQGSKSAWGLINGEI
jgi:hypothetical protein